MRGDYFKELFLRKRIGLRRRRRARDFCAAFASGAAAEQGGSNSHAAIVGLTLDIPVIVNATNATEILKNGAVVQVDAETGTVSSNS